MKVKFLKVPILEDIRNLVEDITEVSLTNSFLNILVGYLITLFRFIVYSIAIVPLLILSLVELIPIITQLITPNISKILLDHETKLLLNNPKGYKLTNYQDGEEFKKIEEDSLDLFILRFMRALNQYCSTKEYNDVFVCGANKRRSLGDIFLICKYYYPECTIEQVLKILITLIDDGQISANYCGTICKVVFFQVYRHSDFSYSTEYSKLTFKEIVKYYKNK